ncbi:MAG: isocitrate/isopropylmalate dehydrogenase family protein [Candidatus Bathyarchaeia archaeon]
MKFRIALIPGDGVGPEQMDASRGILYTLPNLYSFDVEYLEVEAGDGCKARRGIALPDETLNVLKESHACLKGPVGETAAEVIVRLRQILDLYANVRPIKSYPTPIPPLRGDIDFVIVRENTEDVYRGLEFKPTPDIAVCLRVISRKACERIVRYSFNLARKRRGKVTIVHKSNVMKVSDSLFAEVSRSIAKEYPDISLEEMYVDAAAYHMIADPRRFDVIVTTNMFGDILSDEAAALIGSLGLAPSANIGERFALFEPVHGCAPDIAGRGVANPCSLILSASMMFVWLGERYGVEEAVKAGLALEKATIQALGEGFATPDVGGRYTTSEVAEAIASKLRGV